MTTQTEVSTGAKPPEPEVEKQRTWRDYFTFNTDHKVIGIQYLVTSFIFYLIGGALAGVMRTELATPNPNFVQPEFYNRLFTMHGTIMIFLWIIPAGAGFANYLIPLMIGAKDMAFPRLNAVAFWIIPIGGLLLLGSFFVGAPQAGWTSYPPLSLLTGKAGEELWILSVLLLGTSSILGAINFVTTIWKMRVPSMGWNDMPLLCWSMLATSGLILIGTPVLAAAMILLSFDLIVGTTFFNPTGGGDPIVYQHMFWFYSHPAVYIMILPFFGIISEVLPVHARKPIFAYRAIAYSNLAISFLGLLVWAHHMFTSGTPGWLRMFFMATTMLIAVPTGIKVFSWCATLWGGKISLNSSMLFGMGFISAFLIGGLSGVMVASVPFDIHVHDTYFIVAHLHYVLFGGSVLGLFAGIYHWFPKMTGHMLNETWGRIHFALTFIGLNLTFLPMHELGLLGMNRRIALYDAEFQLLNLVCTAGSYLLAVSTIPFLVNAIWSWIRGRQASGNPWKALTLEWQTSSPPAIENFDEEPVLWSGPYDYGIDVLSADSEESVEELLSEVQADVR
ncbi:MAG: cytochrome c oxidase subunit I [Cyanobacteria bacterium QH_8_48_120]|jgi:cytochrome c oxidase subunit 1|nr:MAG: cytochrome c oxidase subunit I [Cyanobacteria bacterium QH_1_48_107]PSO58436.1 MAG: cytochrome c oxidase subunit I [Cyanobacteria bacterium QH_10_48_56]PSO63616.1 MAG: cytochrome c oxidase subunit I [Cyanobacteria bacterium QH_7_48_89]PSO64944.1 MAG: cytochrome c oxidase subunit I [Cyanobacteria bacterium QH_2_48_84]PSO66658.1 MAG: cytochrome c oxidase subunit I [Cyanobacteria bacterium QH_6_48_35]PSO75306.1 MAG: cytochrome c oxidase subunit I [Cyanobacteria bacterium QH_8_48_120]PSO7